MTKLITGRTCYETWVRAAKHLSDQPKCEAFNLFLEITEPVSLGDCDSEVRQTVSAFMKAHNGLPIYTVAETIFPISHYKSGDKSEVFNTYPEVMKEMFSGRPKDKYWGNYALRMIEFSGRDGEPINQIDNVLKKLAADNKKSCFEVAAEMSPYDGYSPTNEVIGCEVPLYDPDLDRRRYLGGPCLSHLSFTRDKAGGTLYLNATYRSHYYMERALGNLVGLSALLAFVAKESEHSIGSLVINATYARFDTGKKWTKTEAKSLIDSCLNLYETRDGRNDSAKEAV